MLLNKLGLICLMVASISGCAGIPEQHPHIILVSKNLCGRYQQVSNDPIQFSEKVVEWKPLSACEGFFALPPEDAAKDRAAYDAWYKSHHKSGQ